MTPNLTPHPEFSGTLLGFDDYVSKSEQALVTEGQKPD